MSQKQFKAVIHTYQGVYGQVAYDLETKQITVELADEQKKQEVEQYLATSHTIKTALGDLRQFQEVDVLASESLEYFKLALTRMWEATDVCVAWSRPVE